MSTKNRLKNIKQSIAKKEDPKEKKIKVFINDMIKYYKENRKFEEKKENDAFQYNILSKRDLIINMNSITEYMVKSYGPELYITIVELDSIKRLGSYLKRHYISSTSRTKMINWMMEIFASYSSEPLSFFLSVEIMDNYLQKTKKIYYENDIHLIGMACIYLASKMEDIIPLHMVHIKTKIGHDKFSQQEIIDMEKDILQALDWDILLITTYDVIKTYLSDFYVNNRVMINNLSMDIICYDLEIISIFLSKLICLHDVFFKYNKCIKAISIIIAAFDILRSNYKMSKEAENFLRQWLLFLVKESKFPVDNVTRVYNKICSFYEEIDIVNKIAPSLCKLYNLRELIKEIK
jgi:hypothetical protein